MKKNSLKQILIFATVITGVNLLISGKVAAQLVRTEIVNLSISEGRIYVIPPASIPFPKTILDPTSSNQEATTNFAANDPHEQITVVDEGRGDTFCLDLNLSDLAAQDGSTIPYGNVGILSVNQNQSASVDQASNNNPATTNNVSAPLNFPVSSVTPATDQIPDGAFTLFTGSSSESDPVVYMERTTAVPGSIGGYSTVPEFRATIPNGTTGETFTGNLTITLTSPIPGPSC